MKRLVVTGIGTGIGKTLVSSIFVQALDADYWKPIQAGSLDASDSDRVRSLVTPRKNRIHPECYRLKEPRSPHAAARSEGIQIAIPSMAPPRTAHPLVIEGAGGVLVPLNDNELLLDFFAWLKAPVVLVSQHYLGSINHTLLSAEALYSRKIPVLGIVFNGNPDPETENAILRHTSFPLLLNVLVEMEWGAPTTLKYAGLLEAALKKHELV